MRCNPQRDLAFAISDRDFKLEQIATDGIGTLTRFGRT
jgi:hypothetical protein